MTIEEEKIRFMSHVQIKGAHWLWTGSTISSGYGKIKDPNTKKYVTAHRYSYKLFVGPVEDGVCVLHKHEGMKLCVNPDCLKPGDQVDNARDLVMSGGSYSGGKITKQDAVEIRESDSLVKDLVKKYGISRRMVRLIQLGRSHKEKES